MTLQNLDFGTSEANDGETLFAAFTKIEANFVDLYGSGGTITHAVTDVASAATCDIGAAATDRVRITGTVTITSLGTSASRLRFVHFSGALTLTHDGTSLILPGAANITTAAGDSAIFSSDASGNWRCLIWQDVTGRGNVTGPSSATDNAVARFDATTGELIQNSIVSVDDSGNIAPVTTDTGALGTSLLRWADLFLAGGAVINVDGDWIATHTAGILTVGTGDVRVTAAGTNTASVVTVGGTQTLTNKTIGVSQLSGQVAIANGGTGQATATAGFDALAPTTTRGDIIFRDASTNARLAASTPGYHLQTNGAGTDPTYAGFLSAGTGAVTRTWQAKSRDMRSVMDFGVVGDGVTDDTTAIQAALTAGGNIWVPPGTYLISGTLTMPASSSIFGGGPLVSVFQRSGLVLNFFEMGDHCTINDISLKRTGATTPTSGVGIEITSSCRVNNVSMFFLYDGIYGNTVAGAYLNSIMVHDAFRHCLFLENGANDVFLSNFIFHGDSSNTTHPLIKLFDQVEAFTAVNGDVLLGGYGMTMSATAYTGRVHPAFNKLTNVYFDSNALSCATVDKSDGITFTSCWFATAGANGLDIGQTEDINAIGCQFVNCYGHGVAIGSSSAKKVRLTNCTAASNNTSNAGADGIIAVSGVCDLSVIGCVGTNDIGTGLTNGNQRYGINLAGSNDRCIIVGNNLVGNVTGALNNGGGSDQVIRGNLPLTEHVDLPVLEGGTGASTAAGARTNLGLGTAAVKNTGTSGDAVPLLNAANTFSAAQTATALISSSAPSAAWALTSGTAAAAVTIANDATYDLEVGSGLFVIAGSDGGVAIFLLAFGNSSLVYQNSTLLSNTVDTASKTNVYFNGSTKYRIQNKTGGSLNYYMLPLSFRNAA